MNVSRRLALALLSLLSLAATPSPNPRPAVELSAPPAKISEQPADQEEADSEPSTFPSPTNQPPPTTETINGKSGTNQIAAYAHETESWLERVCGFLVSITAQGFFNFVMVFATVLIAVFNAQLVAVTRDMHKATTDAALASSESASAAAESARVARLALLGDRPYLMIQNGVIKGFDPPQGSLFENFPTWINLTVKNNGKGPALIERITATLEILSEVRPPRDYSQCRSLPIEQEVVGAGESFPVIAHSPFIFRLSPEQREKILTGDLFLVAYGEIIYSDVFGKANPGSFTPYETGFCWLFQALRIDYTSGELVKLPPRLSRGPATHNYST